MEAPNTKAEPAQTSEAEFDAAWDAASSASKSTDPALDSAPTSENPPDEPAPPPDDPSAGGAVEPAGDREPGASSASPAEDTGTAGPPPQEGPDPAETPLEALQRKFDEREKVLAKREQELKTTVGRLRRFQTEERQAAPAGTVDKGAPDSTAPEQEDATASPVTDALKRVREFDPDVADSLEQVLSPFQERLYEAERKLAERADAERRRGIEAKLAEVEAAVPGWRKDVQTEEFAAWFDQQPGYRQAAFQQTEDSADIIEIFSSYTSYRSSVNGSPASEQPGREQADNTAAPAASPTQSKRRAAQLASAAGVPNTSSVTASKNMGGTDNFDDGWNAAGREHQKNLNRQPRAA